MLVSRNKKQEIQDTAQHLNSVSLHSALSKIVFWIAWFAQS